MVLHINSKNCCLLVFCKLLIQHSRDVIRFNQPYSVIKSAGRKKGCFLFKNEGEGGELKVGENFRRVTALCNAI